MKCKSCGTNLAKRQKFCRNCGKKVQRVSSSAIAIIIAIVLWSLVGIVYIDDCNKEWEEQERQEKIEQQKFAEECPIEVVAKVKDNIIDYPELRCNIKNKTGKDIIAYELYFVPKDVYDEEVNSIFTSKKLGGNDMLKANKSRDVKWSMLDREVKKGDLYVYSVTFDDGSSWGDKDIYSKKIKEYGVQIPISFVK